MLMVAVVMFFAFSCLFTLSPENMADAKAQNIPVRSYPANHFASMSGSKSTFAVTYWSTAHRLSPRWLFSPFFGHYLGTPRRAERTGSRSAIKVIKPKFLPASSTPSAWSLLWVPRVVAYANPNILDLIEAMARQLLPHYCVCYRCMPSVKRRRWRNIAAGWITFVTAVGLLTILNIVYKLF